MRSLSKFTYNNKTHHDHVPMYVLMHIIKIVVTCHDINWGARDAYAWLSASQLMSYN